MSKVLVVDDDPHIRELVRVFLEREGLDVHEATDGVEALAKLDSVKADLVVLDIMMPNMDGWELCRRLRQSGDCPLLILSAKGETSQKIKGFQLGTINVADRIAVVDGGRIVELGTHEQLMSLDGLYARLYAKQFRNGAILPRTEGLPPILDGWPNPRIVEIQTVGVAQSCS